MMAVFAHLPAGVAITEDFYEPMAAATASNRQSCREKGSSRQSERFQISTHNDSMISTRRELVAQEQKPVKAKELLMQNGRIFTVCTDEIKSA